MTREEALAWFLENAVFDVSIAQAIDLLADLCEGDRAKAATLFIEAWAKHRVGWRDA